MTTQIRIMIVEDHELVRKAFIGLLNRSKDIDVIDEAANGKELLDKLRTQVPDIVLMDYRMPVMDGIETLQIIKIKYPNVKVIMLSVHDDTNMIREFAAKGANGFVSKGSGTEVLFRTIKVIHDKGFYFSEPTLLDPIIENADPQKVKKELLSDRELSVLREICNGNTNKDISDRLCISKSTVDFHKGNIYRKTNCKNLVDLVKYAYKLGIMRA